MTATRTAGIPSIPILDLTEQYSRIRDEVEAAMRRVAESGSYILGPEVKELEKEVSAYCDCRFGVGVASGTDALYLALRALRIGNGDEVITSPFSFIATAEAIALVGARPVFVDIDPSSNNIDPRKIKAVITSRTKAIIPVHLYGLPCEMASIMEIAGECRLAVVEDCAQAIGATYRGKKVGSFGAVGCLSFFPSKNLGCLGDGGMVVTNDEVLAERVEYLRRHGGKTKYHHEELGVNSRLDELQAAVLRVKLRHLETWTEARREVAHRYSRAFEGRPGIVVPEEDPESRSVFHQYTVHLKNRDNVSTLLKTAGIQTMVYYPVPLHLQTVFAGLGYERGSFPESERSAGTCLSLPMFPELKDEEQKIVIEALSNATSPQAVE
jgi:dTDP-4-amino-4,6-dideoxygalactose transaminase